MRLTALELENFKGIGRRQGIEFRPITLLFGPNSAGKSMIIQALLVPAWHPEGRRARPAELPRRPDRRRQRSPDAPPA
jgi:recombinational DNA repair ATPase RecF